MVSHLRIFTAKIQTFQKEST